MRFDLIALVLAIDCAPPPAATVAPIVPATPPQAAIPTPAVCARDLSDWSPGSAGSFVPDEVAARALRPAVLALQARVCACTATQPWPASLRLSMYADPGAGRTQVTPASSEPCLATFIATYPPFVFEGDALECTRACMSCERTCHGPPATFNMSFVIPLGD